MNQRDKARQMMRDNGHADELKHVTTRVVGPSPSAANFAHQAVESDGKAPMMPTMDDMA